MKRTVRFETKYLRYYNVGLLISTGILFTTSSIFRDYDPFFVLLVMGAFLLILSAIITASAYFRLIFISSPQKLSMIKQEKDNQEPIKIEIFPYLNEQHNLRFFLEKMEITLSNNYDFIDLEIGGYKKDEVKKEAYEKMEVIQEHKFEINKEKSEDFLSVIRVKENGKNTATRYIKCAICYKRSEKLSLFSLRDLVSVD